MKRFLDIVFSLGGIFIAFPLFIVIVILLKWEYKKGVFFIQERVGKNGKIFKLIKFRTMKSIPGPMITSCNDKRITPLGKFLRKFHLDELPQLLNVLKGEMSIWGPRPEVPYIVSLCPRMFKDVVKFKPGLISPATLLFLKEEKLLDDENFMDKYIKVILPKKINIDVEFFFKESIYKDLKLLCDFLKKVILVFENER